MAAGAPRRRPAAKKGPTGGSGGQKRKGLTGRGPTPKAEDRPYHKAGKSAARPAAGQSGKRPKPASSGGRPTGGARTGRPDNRSAAARRPDNAPELLVGRNPVVESLRAGVPGTALYVAGGMDPDERVREAVQAAADKGIALLEVSRPELDRITGGLLHQGLALQVPPYEYAHPDDLLRRSFQRAGAPLLVALDGVQDPRNLGAVIRSAAAFGADGVLVPERRAAGMTASAWRTSAGAAARLPVARAVNLARALVAYRKAGLLVVGLTGDGGTDLFELDAAVEPVVLVAGSEGKGLSRLVTEACDLTVRIPITSGTESLNASVAMSIALAEIRRRRRVH